MARVTNATDNVPALQILQWSVSENYHNLISFGRTFIQIQRIPPFHCRYIAKPVRTVRKRSFLALYCHTEIAYHICAISWHWT